MPNLGDFLGHVLSEITIARMQADLEALRVADYYASHPLLRHMPVPRFRLPEIEVALPVVIDKVDELPEGEPLRGGVIGSDIHRAFNQTLEAQLSKHSIRMTDAQSKKITAMLEEKVTALSLPVETAVDVNRVSHELARSAALILREPEEEEEEERYTRSQLRSFEYDLKESMRLTLLQVRPPPLV